MASAFFFRKRAWATVAVVPFLGPIFSKLVAVRGSVLGPLQGDRMWTSSIDVNYKRAMVTYKSDNSPLRALQVF